MLLRILLYQLCIWNIVSDGAAEVIGIVLQTCILPCQFTPSPNELIHWQRKMNGSPVVVHSYYNGRDQLAHQDAQYRKRTKLFVSEIGRGNASLLLSDLQLSDNGAYTCYVSNEAGIIQQENSLRVTAPITYLEMDFTSNTETVIIQCSATGSPKPDLSWVDENGKQQNSNSSTIVSNELYSLTQKLIVTDLSQKYTCTARQDTLNLMWNVTWKMQDKITKEKSSNASLLCIFSIHNFDSIDGMVTWTLKTQNSKKTVLQYFKKTNVSDHFKGRASINESDLSFGVATLHLVKLTLADEGEYMCNVSSRNSYQLRITPLRIVSTEKNGSLLHRLIWIRVILVIFSLIIPAGVFFHLWKKKGDGVASRA